MNYSPRSHLLFITSIALLFPAKQGVVNSPISSKVLHRQNSNIHPSKSFPQFIQGNRDDLILWYEDFESGENGWSFDAGWEITETSSNSPAHSVVSPNNNSILNGSFNLLTPQLLLPEIGVDETMHFGFWLHAELPDSDGDDDGYLDDYYNISILGFGESSWHSDDFNSDVGNNFWCADENLSGYLDSWIQYLDTPTITIGAAGELTARIYYAIENSEGAVGGVEGSCTDGWDAANIRISKDGGATWSLLEDSMSPYHFECGYGWIYNDNEYEDGGALNHLAKGWSGESGSWLDFSADLSEFANEEVIIRFAFGSDPAYSTADDGALTGFQVDDISVIDNSGLLFSESGDNMSQMIVGGEVWTDQFYDYGSIEEERPGASGWEEYAPGLPFNGNTFLNISEFAGKTIKLRIQSRYDDNHDGGQGGGLYIDDFMIYKLSTGAYFAPWDLEAEAGDSEVSLVWADMNAAGTDDFIYENGIFLPENTISTVDGTGWAGVLFDVIGPAQINSFSLYNTQGDTTINVEVYGMFGSTIDTEPTYIKEVDIVNGWNEYFVNDWSFENYFVIAHEINPNFGVALDTTQITFHSVLRLGGTWDFALNYNVIGNFGIRANVTYEGAGVSYNIYRDELSIETGLMVNGFTDNDVVNNTTYEYTVSATYDDGEESGQSSSIIVTPLASTIHQESHDDGSFEAEFNAGSGNFSTVRFSADSTGEDIVFFKWFQYGSGGAFYIKVWDNAELFVDDGVDGEANTYDQGEDNGMYDVGEAFTDSNDNGVWDSNLGLPGNEIYSAVQASGSQDGWNEKDLSGENITVSGDFWVGVKEFSSSQPFGLDTTSAIDFSFKRTGSDGDWISINGNLGYRIFLDMGECYYDCAGVCGGDAVEDECGVCGGSSLPEHYDCNGNCIADIDCTGVCGGSALIDECGICNGTGPPENYNCEGNCLESVGTDCFGICGGISQIDVCSNCDGGIVNSSDCDNSGCMDSGACNFNISAITDNGSCVIPPANYNCEGECILFLDCNGVCGGLLLGTGLDDLGNDECGVCGGSGAPEHYNCLGECTSGVDCNGACGGTAEKDDCEICNGNENDGDVNNDGNICESLLGIENIITPYYFGIDVIFPNPFNPATNVRFEVAEFSQVKLSIIDLNGRLVSVLENGKMNPGQYQSLWDGNNSYGNQVSSGIYLAVLESNGMLIQTQKLILLK